VLSREVKIGLIGGVSWVSTREYYRRLNAHFESRLGQHHTPGIVLYSLPFDSILEHQQSGDMASEASVLAEAAKVLKGAGVQFGLICSNTTNRTLDMLRKETSVQFLDIVDAVVSAIRSSGATTVGLLGTRYVTEGGTYVKRLERAGFDVRLPDKDDRDEVHRVIYDELCVNEIRDESRSRIRDMIGRLGAEGCQAVVLGCTELPTLLPEPVLDGVQLIDSVDSHLSALCEAIGLLE
jgi:aspartate racemase